MIYCEDRSLSRAHNANKNTIVLKRHRGSILATRLDGQKDYDKCLASESGWKRKLGKGWIGKKVLGKGNFGVAGLW
jgi:hypothetical protein